MTAPPAAVVAQFNLSSFYKKFAVYQDLPIVSSDKVPDEALQRVYDTVEVMLGKRPDLVARLVQNKIRIAVMGATEVTTDIPEHADLNTAFPTQDWNTRARGVGATLARPAISCAEENVLRYTSDRYRGEDIFVHEFSHTIDQLAMRYVDATWQSRLTAAYNSAIATGKWSGGVYAGSNVNEYWAEGVQDWFNCNIRRVPSDGIHNEVGNRAELQAYDPTLYGLIASVFEPVELPSFSQVLPPVVVNTLPNATVPAGGTFAFSVTATGNPAPTYQWLRNGVPIAGATNSSLTVANASSANVGTYSVRLSSWSATQRSTATIVSNSATVALASAPAGAPTITTAPTGATLAPGASRTLTIAASGTAPLSYQWRRNGATLSGATSASYAINSFDSAAAGSYDCLVTNAVGSVTSVPAVLSLAIATKVVGNGHELAADIVHANGNIFDQVLLEGASATITADPGQITRMSFLDLQDDIVQVEFSGAGSVSVLLENPTGPAAPVKYNQTVTYMRGQATIVVSGADETTNLSVFSVGRANAVNQALFRDDVTYDGLADLALIAIASPTGKFGGLRTANGSYFATKGMTGVYAPGVEFTGPVFVGDISASDTATPVLLLGNGANTRITGGDLLQANGRAVQVSGIAQLTFATGSTSHGGALPAQTNRARLEQNGTDVTAQIVVGP